MARTFALAAGAALAVVGCNCGSGSPPPPATAAAAEDEVPEPGADCPEPAVERADFRHTRSELVTSTGRPRHVAADVVARVGSPFRVEGKLHYGSTGADLEDEDVTAFVRVEACGDWTAIGSGRTDSDGWVAIDAPAEVLAGDGVLELRLVVHGDGSAADGRVFAVPPGARVAVFDIDGTLTTHDVEVAREVADSDHDPEMYEGAVDVVRHHAEAGLLPVYVTGRPYYFTRRTRDWLGRHGFPAGPLRTTRGPDEAVGDGVRAYKRAFLERLRDELGLDIEWAYGNASTDVCAYAEAGVPADRTFIIGPNAGTACEGHAPSQPVASYPEHLEGLSAD